MITAKVIKDGFIQNSNKEFIATDYYDEWMCRGLPKQWDVLITTEAPLGAIAQIRTNEKLALAQRVILLRGNPEVIHQGFLYQAMKSDFVQGELRARSSGTTVAGIKQSELWKVKIPWYPLPIQRRIASILSAYDDLIENNTRRIAILEEMARRIYEEWFVQFRFPGHEQVKMVDSELGKIPEGWEVKKLGELIDFKKGKKPSNVFNKPALNLLPHLLIESLRGGNLLEFVSQEKMTCTNDDDTLMVMDRSGSCDVFVGFSGVIGSTIGRYRAIKNKVAIPYWLFLFFVININVLKAKNVGAAIPHANKDFINSMMVSVPKPEIINKFEQFIKPLFTLIFTLIKILRYKNANLRTTRDFLLPKLI